MEGKITVVDADEVSIGYSNYRLGRGEKSVINYFIANDIDLKFLMMKRSLRSLTLMRCHLLL